MTKLVECKADNVFQITTVCKNAKSRLPGDWLMIGLMHPGRVRADVAKTAALALLKKYNIQVPPVPVEKIIKQENWQLSYFYTSQDPEFANEEGFCRLNEGRYYLYLNAELPAGRDSWTYAHETAHIILKHHELYDVDALTEHEKWLLDREANIFAANYLMSEGWILDRIDNSQILIIADIYNLKTQFGVSWEAMINRLDELNVQSKNFTHSMFNHRRKLVQQDGLIIEADKKHEISFLPRLRKQEYIRQCLPLQDLRNIPLQRLHQSGLRQIVLLDENNADKGRNVQGYTRPVKPGGVYR